MVWIYKGSRRAESYVFLGKQDNFDCLPTPLRDVMGPLEFVMELKLHEKRHLARADAEVVITSIEERGFYIQLPPVDFVEDQRVH